MSQRGKVPFRLIRLKNFLFTLFKNKMAFTGLVVLVLFTFTAVAAPILTPYDPQGTVVSSSLAAPVWITYVSGTQGYSQNTQFSGLSTQSLGSGVHVSNQQAVGQDGVDLTVSVDPSPATGGKLQVTKTVNFPYPGPPGRFIGHASVTPSEPGGGPWINSTLNVYITNSYVTSPWTLWSNQTLYAPLNFLPHTAGGAFDSLDLDLKKQLIKGDTPFSPTQIIFSKVTTYNYTMEITLPQGFQGSFSVRNFNMVLLGNTFGLLGTDAGGHDIFTQFTYGARISLIVGMLATAVGVGLGLVIGLIAGYLGKVVDEVLMRFTDMMLVIPGLPLLIVLVAVLGSSIWNIILILGFLGWMGFARVIRSQVLSLRERPFIEAAKASGAGTGYITLRHILPNVISLTYVNLALSVPAAIVGEAALSFLGLGDTTVVSWGKMLEDARLGGSASNLLWWWTIPPGIGIAVLSLSFILLGYALDELFNPKLRRRR